MRVDIIMDFPSIPLYNEQIAPFNIQRAAERGVMKQSEEMNFANSFFLLSTHYSVQILDIYLTPCIEKYTAVVFNNYLYSDKLSTNLT